MNTVAICIPTYNQSTYLAESVRSACAQTHPVEVWLSDDASTDSTSTVIADLEREFAHLRAFRQERNLGMSGNPRWIVSRPRTNYIVKLDSDDRLHTDYVTRLVALLQEHPNAGYGHCAVRQIDGRGTVTRERRLLRPSGYEMPDDALRAAVRGYRVAANICIFRREAMEQVDFYRADMNFCDDWDLSVRLADAGWGNVYCDALLADYRVWDAGNVRARRKLAEIEGCARVFDHSLLPAFARRGWGTVPLRERRKHLALAHAMVLDAPAFSPDDRKEMVQALQHLGDSPRLRRRVRLMQRGFGPWFRMRSRAQVAAKDAAKRLLRRSAK